MKISSTENTIELYWDDLSEEAQKELIEILGENGNYDVFPLATITISSDD